MKNLNHRRINLILHSLIFITLCAPFFYTGCGSKKAAEAPKCDSVSVNISGSDSIQASTTLPDTTENFEAALSSKESKTQQQATSEENNDETLSNQIKSKHPVIGKLLMADENTITGWGEIFNFMKYFKILSIIVFIVLLVLSLISKLIDKKALQTFLVLDITALISLLCFEEFVIWGTPKALWGYWLCVGCVALLVFHDAYHIIVKESHLRS